jgi:WD40 repeat protein
MCGLLAGTGVRAQSAPGEEPPQAANDGQAEPKGDRSNPALKTPEKSARLDDFGDPLPGGAVRRIGTMRFRQGGGYVNHLLLSPDGKTLISKSYYGERSVAVWEFPSGKLIRQLPGHYDENRALAMSADGKTLAIGQGADIYFFDLASGREVRRLKGPAGEVGGLAFSSDGKLIASGHEGREVLLWDLGTETVKARLPAKHNRLTLLAFSPDCKTLATGDGLDPTIRLFDVASLKERHQIKRPSDVHDFAFSPDGSTLAAGARDGVITLWDPVTGTLLVEVRGPGKHVRAVAWSPDGKTLAASEYELGSGDYD